MMSGRPLDATSQLARSPSSPTERRRSHRYRSWQHTDVAGTCRSAGAELGQPCGLPTCPHLNHDYDDPLNHPIYTLDGTQTLRLGGRSCGGARPRLWTYTRTWPPRVNRQGWALRLRDRGSSRVERRIDREG